MVKYLADEPCGLREVKIKEKVMGFIEMILGAGVIIFFCLFAAILTAKKDKKTNDKQ